MRNCIVLGILCIAFSVRAQTVSKQDSIKRRSSREVIVTGFPAEERKTPAPFEKIDRVKIASESNLRDIPSFIADLPSVVFYSQSGLDFGYTYANIRGFDQRRQSVLVNGIPQNDPEDQSVYWIDMPDLSSSTSSISVQRGAGTAFYGPPAIGGSINITTAPSAKREIIVSSEIGTYNTSKLGITLNSGLIDNKYAIMARLSQLKTDGYRHNAFIDEKAYYLSVARYDSNFTLQLNFYGGPISDGLDYYGIFPSDSLRSNFKNDSARRTNYSESFIYERRPEEREQFFQPHYELLSSWDIEKDLTFNNTLFFIQGDGQFDFDGTWVFPFTGYSHSYYYALTPEYGKQYGFKGITDTTLGNELTRAFVGNKHFGWLPKFEYRHDNGTLTVGGEFRIHRSTHWGKLLSASRLPIDLPGDYKFYDYKGGKDILSGYLAENMLLGDVVNVQGSLQILSQTYRFYDEKPFFVDSVQASSKGLLPGFTSYSFTVPLLFVNPRLGANILLSNELSALVSASYTSREPRLKDYYNAEFFSEPNFERTQFATYDFNAPKVKPEHLFDGEVGVNYADQISENVKLQCSLNGYFMPFTDELIKTGKTDRFGSSIVGNAESVIHYGGEFHAAVSYNSLFSISTNLTISHNEIRQFDSYKDPQAVIGKVPIGFPSIIGGVAVQFHPFDLLTFGVTGHYVGDMYGDLENTDTFKNEAFFVLDGSIGLKQTDVLGFQSIQIKLRLNNITNNLFTTYSEAGSGFFVAAPFHMSAGLEIGL